METVVDLGHFGDRIDRWSYVIGTFIISLGCFQVVDWNLSVSLSKRIERKKEKIREKKGSKENKEDERKCPIAQAVRLMYISPKEEERNTTRVVSGPFRPVPAGQHDLFQVQSGLCLETDYVRKALA